MFYLSKNKLHSNQKPKNNVILSVRNVHRVQRCMHSFNFFPYVWWNPVKSFCVMETVYQTRYCRFVWHRRVGKCIPKLILASKVRTRCQVVFFNEHSLVKKHPYTSTVWWQLRDGLAGAGYNLTWRGLLYSHSDIACLLIQSNCTELQPSINILIWVVWIFDHSVFGLQDVSWDQSNDVTLGNACR
jgi:hypothetical protein